MKRKIIQIAFDPPEGKEDSKLYAVCDDGTLWFRHKGEWKRWDVPIPQDNEQEEINEKENKT